MNLLHAAPVPEEAPGELVTVESPGLQPVDAASEAPEAANALVQDEVVDAVMVLDAADRDQPNELPLTVADLPETSTNTATVPDAVLPIEDAPPPDTLADQPGSTEVDDHKTPKAVPEPGTDQVSFLRESDRALFGSGKVGQALLGLTAITLLFVLLVQWLYWDRDRLATAHPELKPALQAYCKLMNCKISAVKRVEAVSIDSATFNKAGPENYRLSFTIKNLSGLTLAWPSIELTLTDVQDQVIVRRVLSPAELFVTDEDLLAGSDRSVSVVIKIAAIQAVPPIMGYRLLAFYP